MEDAQRLWTLNQQAELLTKEMEILKPRFVALEMTDVWWEIIERAAQKLREAEKP